MPLAQHLAEPVKKLETLLSESATFQTLVGATDAVAALESIHYGYAEDSEFGSGRKDLPRAIVALEDFDSTKSTTSTFETTILLSLYLESETPTAEVAGTLGDRYMWWLETVETIVDELKASTADQTRLLIDSYSSSIVPQRKLRTENETEQWYAAFVMEAKA